MEKLPSTSYIFVDRRKTGRGKSLPNRQRLLRRIKQAIRSANPNQLAGSVKGMAGQGGTVNPVRVTRASLHEPTFHYDQTVGKFDVVLIGNDIWERGDDFPLESESQQSGGGAGGPGTEDGEDDFVVNVSREEFLDVFFEECVLPNMQDTHTREIPEYEPKHAGFQRNGNPAQLSVKRSYKNAFARKKILTSDAREELEELTAEYDEKLQELGSFYTLPSRAEVLQERLKEIEERSAELRQKISSVPFFEDVDLRYTKKEKVLVKAADAVFCIIMDISGSMDEEKKRIARMFFSLQYAFIKRKYPHTDLIFIAHTTEAQEMQEEEFFSTRVTGGTMVSPAYELANKILAERYDATQTNIYLSQASDGDNWDDDNQNIEPTLVQSGLLSKVRHMAYVHVGVQYSYAFSLNAGNDLWSHLTSIASSHPKVDMVKIVDQSQVYEKFHEIYKK